MKILLSTILFAAAALGASAGNPAKLFGEFKTYENTEYVNVPGFLLRIAKHTGALDDVPMAGKVTGVKVLDMENCPASVKERFEKRLKEETPGYDELITVKSEGSRVRIYSHIEGETLKNLYIFATDSTECAFIELSGKFTTEDLKKICEK